MLPSPRLIACCLLGVIPLLFVPLEQGIFGWVLLYDLLLLLGVGLDWFLSPRQHKLSVMRETPNAFVESGATQVALRVENRSKMKLQAMFWDQVPETFQVEPSLLHTQLNAREVQHIHYHVVASQRGDATFGNIQVRIPSRLGLFLRQFSLPAEKIVPVYPNLTALKKYDLIARSHQSAQSGLRLLRRRGRGSEFERLREYTPDDEFRNINWKATAKRGFPITQVYQTERSQNVMVVLDFGRNMGGMAGSQRKLDAAIEAAMLLCHVAQRFEDRFGLLLFSHKPVHFIPPQKGTHHFQRVLKTLYNLEPLSYDTQFRELFRFLAARHRKRSLVVIFTDLGDEEAAERVQRYVPLLMPTHLPLCISISDPSIQARSEETADTTSALYRRTAALEMKQQRDKVILSLRRNGVLLIDRPPEQLSPETINQYLQIKMKQLL